MRIVCGLDVHKDSVFCCILCANGEKIQHKFGVLTEELVTLRDLMVSEGVEECAMESTSIYWIPIWRVLEGSVKLHLVNPYFIKQLPGKKSDVNDAEWIATCLSKELIASSFVPDDKIQRLRQYDRRIFDLNASISRNLVKLDQCIQRCNIRISNYISTTDSKGYRSIVKLISQGVTDAEVLVKELHGRTINRLGRYLNGRSTTAFVLHGRYHAVELFQFRVQRILQCVHCQCGCVRQSLFPPSSRAVVRHHLQPDQVRNTTVVVHCHVSLFLCERSFTACQCRPAVISVPDIPNRIPCHVVGVDHISADHQIP